VDRGGTLVVNAATASPVLITALTTAERHREREEEGGRGAEERRERAGGESTPNEAFTHSRTFSYKQAAKERS